MWEREQKRYIPRSPTQRLAANGSQLPVTSHSHFTTKTQNYVSSLTMGPLLLPITKRIQMFLFSLS